MGNFYELTKAIRMTGKFPVDGDRYIAANIAERDARVENTGYNGLMVYVVDASGDTDVASGPALYILKDESTKEWERIPLITQGGDVGVSNFIDLKDTPANWSTAKNGSLITVQNNNLTFEDALSAFNRNFASSSIITFHYFWNNKVISI